MGYRWHPVVRLVPAYGDARTIDLTQAFTDASGPVETEAGHREEIRRRTDVNRRSRPQIYGFRPFANFSFDILTMEDHASLVDIVGCLSEQDAKVYLSLDGGITEREVALRRYRGPRAIAGKQFVGGTYQLQIEAVDLIDRPAAMALDPEDGLMDIVRDGRIEDWASATDLTSWTETIVGGTVNRDSAEQRSGNHCCRFDRTVDPGKLSIGQAELRLRPGFWYEMSAWYKGDTVDSTGFWMRLRNTQESKEITNLGEWVAVSAPVAELLTFAVSTSYQQAKVRFRVDPTFAVSDTYNFEIQHNSSNGSTIYVDDIDFRGPVLQPGGGTW